MRAALLLVALLAAGCDNAVVDRLVLPGAADWNHPVFTCTHEADRLPRPDPQAEALYRRSEALDALKDTTMGVAQQLRESFALKLQAAERGHVRAMDSLVDAYLLGRGVQRDEAKAVEWTRKLIALNVGLGYRRMSHFVEYGTGVPKGDAHAHLALLRKAADLGNGPAQQDMGALIPDPTSWFEVRRKRSLAVSRALLQCAFAQGEVHAGYLLGVHYQVYEGKMSESLAAHQAAAKQGAIWSLDALQEGFDKGGTGLQKDPARAACYRRLAEEIEGGRRKTLADIDTLCPLPPAPMPPGS